MSLPEATDDQRSDADARRPIFPPEDDMEEDEARLPEDYARPRPVPGWLHASRDASPIKVIAHKVGAALSRDFRVIGVAVFPLSAEVTLEGGLRVVITKGLDGWWARVVFGGPCWPWEKKLFEASGASYREAGNKLAATCRGSEAPLWNK